MRDPGIAAMTSSNSRHVFFVDDEPNVRHVIGETLEQVGLNVSCFASAADCLENLSLQKCDLLITGLRMPEINGIELLRRGKLLIPWVPVLIVTDCGDIPTAVECIKAGAVDVIEKPLDKEDFLQRVKSILQENAEHRDTHLGKDLTRSEMRVLKLILDGKTNKEIAHLLSRSKRTIEAHRAAAMRKLGVDNLVDLVVRARTMGLADPPTGQEPSEAVSDN
jgi:two-component system response regulator FixJ